MPWITATLPSWLVEELVRLAESRNKTLSEVIEEALILYLGCKSTDLVIPVCSETN